MSDKIPHDRLIIHPLEDLFGLPSGSTVSTDMVVQTPIIKHETYDDKDVEIEKQYQEVYDAALTAYDAQMDDIGVIDPKFRARNGEIAVTFLNTALAAAKEKANLKIHRDKMSVNVKTNTVVGGENNTVTNNTQVIVADRNELLKMMMDAQGKSKG
jgi:hypothetical protein